MKLIFPPRKDGAELEFSDCGHPTDEVLELYSMGRLAEPDLGRFEEHLLVCGTCQDRLAQEDDIRQRIRDGAAVLQQPRTAVFRRLPRLAWISLAAAVCMIVFAGMGWESLHRRAAPASVILLQATRGAESTPLAAPAGKPLIVVLDVTGLQQFPGYKLEIVDAAGHPVFQSSNAPQNNKLQAAVARGLAAGVYFVRVYTPAQELLREFALMLRD
ncbi:MAG: T9SS type A sorting domain-containing protein [Bryobacteraceae bacterium]|jgi:hypothetical protein